MGQICHKQTRIEPGSREVFNSFEIFGAHQLPSKDLNIDTLSVNDADLLRQHTVMDMRDKEAHQPIFRLFRRTTSLSSRILSITSNGLTY
jgi:hypothetical protein